MNVFWLSCLALVSVAQGHLQQDLEAADVQDVALQVVGGEGDLGGDLEGGGGGGGDGLALDSGDLGGGDTGGLDADGGGGGGGGGQEEGGNVEEAEDFTFGGGDQEEDKPTYRIVQAVQPSQSYKSSGGYRSKTYSIGTTQRKYSSQGGSSSSSSSEEQYNDGDASYNFAYEVRDDYTYNYQARQEERDEHKVSGVYQYVNPFGRMVRVTYSDDGYGFHANVEELDQDIFDKSYYTRGGGGRGSDSRER